MSLSSNKAMRDNKASKKSIYSKMLITRKIQLNIVNIGNDILNVIEKIVVQQLEGKCVVEGFIKQNSVRVQNYSSGELYGSKVLFDVVIECEVCCPVEGMEISCIAKNITKAGIRAEIQIKSSDVKGDFEQTPVIIFLARDHHTDSSYFSNIKLNDKINVRVIGQRFELNDKYVSVIAELIVPDIIQKPKLKMV